MTWSTCVIVEQGDSIGEQLPCLKCDLLSQRNSDERKEMVYTESVEWPGKEGDDNQKDSFKNSAILSKYLWD